MSEMLFSHRSYRKIHATILIHTLVAYLPNLVHKVPLPFLVPEEAFWAFLEIELIHQVFILCDFR